MDWLVILFIFFVVTVITAALFCGWAVWAILRFIIRAISGSASHPPALPAGGNNGNGNGNNGHALAQSASSPGMVRCSRSGCLAHNPATARFCRRCGAALPSAEPVIVRRAAVW
jgi:hypothetical protein